MYVCIYVNDHSLYLAWSFSFKSKGKILFNDIKYLFIYFNNSPTGVFKDKLLFESLIYLDGMFYSNGCTWGYEDHTCDVLRMYVTPYLCVYHNALSLYVIRSHKVLLRANQNSVHIVFSWREDIFYLYIFVIYSVRIVAVYAFWGEYDDKFVLCILKSTIIYRVIQQISTDSILSGDLITKLLAGDVIGRQLT